MIECRGLAYMRPGYDGVARSILQPLDLRIEAGERVVLLGINGSGKSSLLRLLGGVAFATSGAYLFEGEAVNERYFKRHSEHFRRSVALQMQEPASMLFNPSVYEEIAYGPRRFGLNDVEERTARYAALFGLETHLKKSPHDLSGGEKQRVLLAALLALEPRVLLLDEPTAHLDPPASGHLIDLLQSLHVTTLISTHNLTLARELGSRALVLGRGGHLLYDGPLDALLQNQELLLQAELLHRHAHSHKGVSHSHYHLHDWS